MAFKSVLDQRLDRLARKLCVIHGLQMLRIPENSPDFPKNDLCLPSCNQFFFKCIKQNCEITTHSESEHGPYVLASKFSELINPDLGQLPIQTEEQLRGIQAATICSLALTKIAFVHAIETGSDIGIDFVCEIRADESPTGKIFNVQCKVLPLDAKTEKSFFTYAISVKTVRYWLEQPYVTIMMIACEKTGLIYWDVPSEQESDWNKDWRKQGSVNIKINTENCIKLFSPIPKKFFAVAASGLVNVGAAFRERSFTLIQAASKNTMIGKVRSPKEYQEMLFEDKSTLSETIKAARSIDAHHKSLFDIFNERVREYETALHPILEDVYRAANLLYPGSKWLEDGSSFKEDKDKLTATVQAVKTLSRQVSQGFNISDALEELLKHLRVLEDVNDNAIFIRDDNEYKIIQRQIEIESKVDNNIANSK